MMIIRQTIRSVAQQFAKTSNRIESRSIKRWVAPTLRELKRRRDKVGPEPLQPRSTYLEWNYEAEVFAFGKRLGEEFNTDILKQALVHREYSNMEQIKAQDTGNSILERIDNFDLIKEGDTIISQYVKQVYKSVYPEEITNSLHNYLTSTDMLAHVGKYMGLSDLIKTTEFPVQTVTLAKTFKAIVAALKQSQNLDTAHLFIKDFLICQMNGKDVYEIWDPEHPYEYLTHLLAKKGINEIEPRLCNQSAVNTILANYQVGLYDNKKLLGIGWGESIQIAKETAAVDAIRRIHSNYDHQSQ